MYRIFIVEDDSTISSVMKKHIESWGFEALCAENFRDIMPEFTAFAPHLVLLDISLPFFNGFHWCSKIRLLSSVPVIFVSSASDNMNIVMAMNMGADDFISKPFDLNVLTAKIQAMLRRAYDFKPDKTFISHRDAVLDTDSASLIYKDTHVELTKNDFRILKTLMENKGKVVSRDELMEKLWETDNYVDENTLTVNVTRLRKKLEAAGLDNFISTKKGLGYIVE